MPRPGERYPAWFDRNDPEKWMFGTDMDASQASAEVKDLFARAAAGGPSAPLVTGGPHPVGDAEPGPVEELESLTERLMAKETLDMDEAYEAAGVPRPRSSELEETVA